MDNLPDLPSSPRQLQMQFDSARLQGMSPEERQHVVTRLASLLADAVAAARPEEDNDGR